MPTDTPARPPEAELIEVARLARGISPETAAKQTPVRLGGSRWRHIEQGYSRKVPFKRVSAPAQTLAHMAHVVGVTPESLTDAGRNDASQILAEILRQEAVAAAQAPPPPPPEDPRVTRARQILDELPPHIREEVLRGYGGELPQAAGEQQHTTRQRRAG